MVIPGEEDEVCCGGVYAVGGQGATATGAPRTCSGHGMGEIGYFARAESPSRGERMDGGSVKGLNRH